MIKSYLIHLGMNLWEDNNKQSEAAWRNNCYRQDRLFCPRLQLDEPVWHHELETLSQYGCNLVVFDLADGVRYESHPEIAVEGAWSTAKLSEEIARCRELGMEPIPKLNFSATHDAWMGEYSRMVSTRPYYAFCHDLIQEVSELFAKPRFFHIGMDEEVPEQQLYYDYVVVRRREILHHDLQFYFDEVRKAGCRPWMFADSIWHLGTEEYQRLVPKDVLQSNWYYYGEFNFQRMSVEQGTMLDAYLQLDKMGYDQILCGSNWDNQTNYPETVAFARHFLRNSPHFLGYMMAPWVSSEEHNLESLDQAMELFRATHENEERYVSPARKTWPPRNW